jgi:hypothetical protein
VREKSRKAGLSPHDHPACGASHRLQRQIAALACRQHGNVSREQLLKLEMSTSAIGRWVAAGRLHHVHHGVYAVGRPPMHALERAMAAVLSCGDPAWLSGAAALALWELGPWPRAMEVSAPGEHRIPGLPTRRLRTLARRDVTRVHNIPVLCPARAILEHAPHLSEKALSRTVNDALRRKLMREERVAELLARRANARGAARLRPLVTSLGGPTRSELEDEFLAFCARHGLPRPETCVVVDGYEVDALFRAERLIVELDGWQFHRDRGAFETDRRRDGHALLHGNATLRLTHARMRDEPAAEAERLQRILHDRGAAAG